MPAYTTTMPLRFGDCDPAGIAYFPSYIDKLTGVVEEMFAAIGAPLERLVTERVGIPTVHLDVTFTKPGLHGDKLAWSVVVTRVGRSSADLVYSVSARGHELWRAKQTIVFTSLDTHASLPWPEEIRRGLMRFAAE